MTEVVATSSQPRDHHSALMGPLTRSAMAATRPAGGAEPAVARQRESETSPTAPLSPSSDPHPPNPPPPSPGSGSRESGRSTTTKKRAASINTEEANRPKIENLSLGTPSTASPRPVDAGRDLICLCTPAPKVPRPRNAFILYRQHYQAQVVQQNPGLANPEISKIIGEQWRDEPEESKNQWKLLAEEEKQRHQRQYPDYRYQPRRGNKTGSSQSGRPSVAPGEDPHRCPKCGGRYIATPRTPSTPFMTPAAAKPVSTTTYGPPSGHHQTSESRSAMSRSSRSHWGPPQPSSGNGGGGLYDMHEDFESTISPNEAKRRRYNAAGSYHNYHALPSPPPPFPPSSHHAASSHPHPHPRQQPSLRNPSTTPSAYPPPPSLPGPSSMLPRGSPGPSPGPMPPPPRPSHVVPQLHPYYPSAPLPFRGSGGGGPPSDFDESVRLPPLQTHLPTSPDNGSEPSTGGGGGGPIQHGWATGLGILHPTPTIPSYSSSSSLAYGGGVVVSKRERDAVERAQARSVEAMVMSISFVNKLRVLERISPPLAASEPAGRGPVIAVEGPDTRLVKAVAGVVERALKAAAAEEDGRWEVRCWEDESVSKSWQQQQGVLGSGGGGVQDVPMPGAGMAAASGSRHGSQASIAVSSTSGVSSSPNSSGGINPFTAYLRTITDWHAKSAEIVKFVTSISSSSSSTVSTTPTQGTATHHKTESETTARSTGPTTQRHPLPKHPATPPSGQKLKPKLPIALLPSGFSLTLSDSFACAVPISDAYAPVDHWQWMATLWRGIVGADLVVYVLPRAQAPYHSGVDEPSIGSDVVGGGGGAVEVRSGGLIVVKVPVPVPAPVVGPGSVIDEGAGIAGGERDAVAVSAAVDEKMERRLGFEVVEWVRSSGWVNMGRGMDGQVAMEY
ncbi:putative HMG-box-containing domain protein [Achaetomium macrosporum]|uniref:HMG-box-containing domain protein n=1 Tax=Achaetomium macrosporum TaxID=79813 RepID=A0AAN7HC77_9PEZI|nr:putative HMG-box-containing domain protein [Achaetomium macrosporum]